MMKGKCYKCFTSSSGAVTSPWLRTPQLVRLLQTTRNVDELSALKDNSTLTTLNLNGALHRAGVGGGVDPAARKWSGASRDLPHDP